MFDQEGTSMSVDEMRIRGELEKEIERDLEEEIKDEIYRLALRLHRFYLHEKERNRGEEAVTQVSITIRMEGTGTNVEINENKKNGRENARPQTSRSMESTTTRPKAKKFDWAESLRSEPRPLSTKKKNGSHNG